MKARSDEHTAIRIETMSIPEPNTGCWLWTGCAARECYGVMSVGPQTRRATHLSYFIHHGVDPDGSVVMHSCDVPNCVNPGHLTQGTQKENVADMIRKGRHNALTRALLGKRRAD